MCPRSLTVAAVALLATAVPGQLVFAPPESFADGGPSLATVLADLDADGDLDVIVSTTEPAVRVFLAGPGGLAPGQVFDGAGGGRLGLRDLDGDQVLDLVLAQTGFSPGALVVRRGQGDGTFGNELGTGAGTNPSDFVITDVDGDAVPDIIVVTLGIQTLVPPDVDVLIGKGDGFFVLASSQQLPAAPLALDVLDANGDGEPGIAIAFDDGTVRVLYGAEDGDGFAGSWTVDVHDPDALASKAVDLVALDFDGDGIDDIASTWSDGVLSVLTGVGDGTYGTLRFVAVGGQPGTMAVADFDANGVDDLVIANPTSAELAFVWRDADLDQLLLVSGVPGAQGPAVGDVDADGRPDVVVGSALGGTRFVRNATYLPGAPFADLGGSLPGGAGWPILIANGDLAPGAPFQIDLFNGPAGLGAVLVVGSAPIFASFKGGTLVPEPGILLAATVDATGRAAFGGGWPIGLSGVTFHAQWWMADEDAPTGWAASTGLQVDVP